MRMPKIGFMLVLIAVLSISCVAADFEHREFGVYSRGMGGASSAVLGGIDSLGINPAGLAQQTKKEILVAYQDQFSIGLDYSNFAYAQELFGGGIGISFGQFTNVEDLFYQVSSTQISYGHSLGDLPISGGVSLRHSRLDSLGGQASNTSLDFGLQGSFKNFAWGLAVYNIFSKADPPDKAESALKEVKIGLGYAGKNRYWAAELVNARELRLGVEQILAGGISIRGGLNDGSPTMGLGLSKGSWKIDYSFELGLLGNTHSFALSRSF